MIYRINVTATGYQKWTGFPDSPVAVTEYLEYSKQAILYYNGSYWLVMQRTTTPPHAEAFLIASSSSVWESGFSVTVRRYRYVSGAWSLWDGGVFALYDTIVQANHDIYSSSDMGIVVFAKTTTEAQDVGKTIAAARIRNVHVKNM